MKDKYVYPGTSVLINKFDIRDNKKLDETEYAYVSLNLTAIIEKPFKIKSLFDIHKIHKLLFEDLYDWAGQDREINIYKDEPVLDGLSVQYSDYKEIDFNLRVLDAKFKQIEW